MTPSDIPVEPGSELSKTLLGRTPSDYGQKYDDHVLEIYRLYVEMADRVSSRRNTANSFFLTLNSALLGFVGYLATAAPALPVHSNVPLSIVGITLSYLWARIIRSYRDLNTAKFKVIHEIEARLPMRPYDAEWHAVGRGLKPELYKPLTHIEVAVPRLFLALHAVVGLAMLFL